jgi:hypothetical protein
VRIVKYACFSIHKIDVQSMKNNNEHYVSKNSPGSKSISEYSERSGFSKSVDNFLLVLILLNESKVRKTSVMGRLVKIGFSCHTPTIRPSFGPYVRRVTMDRTFGHDTVCPL